MLLNSGWTIAQLIEVLGTGHLRNDSVDDNSDLKLTTAILEAKKELKKSLAFLFTDNITSETVVECASRSFDQVTAKVVVEFVEGISLPIQ